MQKRNKKNRFTTNSVYSEPTIYQSPKNVKQTWLWRMWHFACLAQTSAQRNLNSWYFCLWKYLFSLNRPIGQFSQRINVSVCIKKNILRWWQEPKELETSGIILLLHELPGTLILIFITMIVLTAPFHFLLAAVLRPVAIRRVEAVASGHRLLCCLVTEAAAVHAAPTNPSALLCKPVLWWHQSPLLCQVVLRETSLLSAVLY